MKEEIKTQEEKSIIDRAIANEVDKLVDHDMNEFLKEVDKSDIIAECLSLLYITLQKCSVSGYGHVFHSMWSDGKIEKKLREQLKLKHTKELIANLAKMSKHRQETPIEEVIITEEKKTKLYKRWWQRK